jgi:hypothetical protein
MCRGKLEGDLYLLKTHGDAIFLYERLVELLGASHESPIFKRFLEDVGEQPHFVQSFSGSGQYLFHWPRRAANAELRYDLTSTPLESINHEISGNF